MKSKKIIIHNGGFHADDVFATEVALRYLEKQGVSRGMVEVIRTRDTDIIEAGDIVLDVGGVLDPESFRFDHHQEGGAGVRGNGVPYAAFGLAWKHLGPKIGVSEFSLRYIDEKLVQTIDAFDNGVDIFGTPEIEIPNRYTLQSVFVSLHPSWDEKSYTIDDAFKQALIFAHTIFEREICHASSEEKGQVVVREQYELTKYSNPQLLILDNHYPYNQAVESMPDVKFVVKPSENGETWNARTVRIKRSGFNARRLFPQEWAGKTREELVRLTGVPDVVFVHNKRFIAVAKSKEGAMALAQKGLSD
jgi:uncharacterized UPF0160 family protein